MIEAWHVREALRFRFGSALVDIPGIWDRAAKVLQAYAPYKDTFADMAVRLEDVLFNTVYEQLGPSMGVEMDDGSLRRIRSAELKDAADDVMGVLFDQLKVYSVTYESLHQYCIDTVPSPPCACFTQNTRISCRPPSGRSSPGSSGTTVPAPSGKTGSIPRTFLRSLPERGNNSQFIIHNP